MAISLDKRVEAATVSLQKLAADSKIDLGDVCAQVTISADRSGSAASHWPDLYQEAIERALALTLTGLDDDEQVPFLAFDSEIVGEEILSASNYEGFVAQFHRNAGGSSSMGGTAFSPVIEKLLQGGHPKKRFGKSPDEKNEPPFFHMFFTDGEPNYDKDKIEKLLIGARTRPHFFQFILIGGDSRGEKYLQHLNNELSGPGIDNVGLTIYSGHPPTDDTGFFNDTIREFFLDWLPAARGAGITSR